MTAIREGTHTTLAWSSWCWENQYCRYVLLCCVLYVPPILLPSAAHTLPWPWPTLGGVHREVLGEILIESQSAWLRTQGGRSSPLLVVSTPWLRYIQANKDPGDIGYEPQDVETNLENNFRLAHHWGCVLLLDEADVFLGRRDKHDLKRNSMVSGEP